MASTEPFNNAGIKHERSEKLNTFTTSGMSGFVWLSKMPSGLVVDCTAMLLPSRSANEVIELEGSTATT